MSALEFLTREEVTALHDRAIALTGGPPGLRDEGLLDSALAAPANRFHYEGADLATCAATYAFHLVRNHPFVDGNKRVGLAASIAFVRLNRAEFNATEDELVEFFLALAAGDRTREEAEAAFGKWVVETP